MATITENSSKLLYKKQIQKLWLNSTRVLQERSGATALKAELSRPNVPQHLEPTGSLWRSWTNLMGHKRTDERWRWRYALCTIVFQ